MKILFVANYRPGVGGISGQIEILQRKLREDGHVGDIYSTKGSVFYRMLCPTRLLKVGRNYEIFHIHCCSGLGFFPAVLGITVGRLLGKRILLTYHGGGAETFFAKHSRFIKRWLQRVDEVIVLSDFLGTIFTQYDIPHSVIPNMIDFDTNHFRIRNVSPKFICVRSFTKLYNIECILRAYKIVKSQLPNASLTLVGDGPERQTLESVASQLNVSDVFFVGRVDNSEIYKYLDNADIMLSSPVIDNMPVSILEGFNAGLLVISSNVGGVPYMIQHKKNGLLFESNNALELSDLMLWAIEHPDDTELMVHRAHESLENYSWNKIKIAYYSLCCK